MFWFQGPGWLPGIAGNARSHGNDRKIHKRDQTLIQTKTNINKLCFGKISLQRKVRIKFSVDSWFSNVLYGKKTTEMSEINRKLS